MIHEQQQEQAALYVLGALNAAEQSAFEGELRVSPELSDFVRSLQGVTGLLAQSLPAVKPPAALREKVLRQIDTAAAAALASLRFVQANEAGGWKQLPVPGAWIKLLSLERERGYAVLLGKLEPGTRYPAHVNVAPEDLYVLTGDLHIGSRRLGPGDFHHADAGSYHEVNYSEEGCTILAVLTADHPLVAVAMS